MFTSGLNPSLVRTAVDEVFFQTYEMDENDWRIATAENPKLFPVVNTTHAAYIGIQASGTRPWGKVGETTVLPDDTPVTKNTFTVPVQDFAQNLLISKNLFDDDMWGTVKDMVTNYAKMARVAQDLNAFAAFRGAFTTTLTPDGQPWISASHVLHDGTTVSNLITGALSNTTLATANLTLRQQKTNANVIMGSNGRYLVVPLALFDEAIRITDSALVSDNANNAINVFKNVHNLEIHSSPYLGAETTGGSDTAWFLLSSMHGLKRLVRQGVQTEMVEPKYSDNRHYKYTGDFREEVFVENWFGAVGTLGT